MAFNVRVFGHTGLAQIPIFRSRQFSSDSVFQVTQPPEWGQVVSVSGVAASSTPVADASPGRPVTVAMIEVPDGQAVRYQVNTSATNVAASTTSPKLTGGINYVEFRSGYTISFIDAAGLP